MRRRVQMWGNSLGVRIPVGLAEETGLVAGAEVEVTAEDGRLVITPATSPKYELEGLLQGVTQENLHGEPDFGAPVGREEW